MDIPEPAASRVAAVYAWRESFIRANTRWVPFVPDLSHWEGAVAAGAGQYVVDFSATWTGTFGTGTVTGRVVQVFATEGEAAGCAGMITGVSGMCDVYHTCINGYAVALNNNPGGPRSVTSYGTWAATASTQVAATPADPGVYVSVPAVPAHWEGAALEFAAMRRVLGLLLPCLVQVYTHTEALTGWDALWAEARDTLDAYLRRTTGDDLIVLQDSWFRRYAAACDNLRITAGIYPL